MLPRSDGKAYDTEAVVNADNCLSCGICVGACPTATPFRRATAIVPGIELPDHAIARLRDDTIAASGRFNDDTRVLVYACDRCGMGPDESDGAQIVTMPCIAMLPPSFIDFVLSRGLADGVALAGCASADCYYRLGDKWTSQRLRGERDPYLRKRVDTSRLRHLHVRPTSGRQHRKLVQEFAASVEQLPRNSPRGGRRDA